jgi:hypothetical protein
MAFGQVRRPFVGFRVELALSALSETKGEKRRGFWSWKRHIFFGYCLYLYVGSNTHRTKWTTMKTLTIQVLIVTFFALTSCNTSTIDKNKRDILVKKYDLMNFKNLQQPTLMTIDEFFDGNKDEASIAPNLDKKPKVSQYYETFKALLKNPKVVDGFVKINEVMIYEGGKLNDNEWFYSDMIYIVGDITKEEVKEATKTLLPDEVEYDSEGEINKLDEKFKDKKVVYIWWD